VLRLLFPAFGYFPERDPRHQLESNNNKKEKANMIVRQEDDDLLFFLKHFMKCREEGLSMTLSSSFL